MYTVKQWKTGETKLVWNLKVTEKTKTKLHVTKTFDKAFVAICKSHINT